MGSTTTPNYGVNERWLRFVWTLRHVASPVTEDHKSYMNVIGNSGQEWGQEITREETESRERIAMSPKSTTINDKGICR
jgi:hypothetical protein